MQIKQIYTGCLAQGAYYIESDGEVAIVDPLREVQSYIDRAAADGAKIKYILETHFHADFVSGHLTLAEKTGATIVYGPSANPGFDVHIAADGEELKVGKLTIKVLHTPGHTLESTTYLLLDENGREHAIFTGDTLFIGDVGRPDLAQKANELTQEDLAGMLFDSLRTKIMPLHDDVIVYPAHGAGSACGKNMSSETEDTLGNQKQSNYALRADMTKAEFIKEVTDGLLPPPVYFPANVQLNKQGYNHIDAILKQGLTGLSADEFESLSQKENTVILDVRHQKDFVKGFVPNAVFIGLDGGFAPWVGAIIGDVKTKILLIAPEGREEEAITRLARVGFDNIQGYLQNGVKGWKSAGKSLWTMDSEPAQKVEENYGKEGETIVDVRKPGEFAGSHIKDAISIPLDYIQQNFDKVPANTHIHLHCAGGYRSVIAGSLLMKEGITNFVNVEGGYKDLKQLNLPLTSAEAEIV